MPENQYLPPYVTTQTSLPCLKKILKKYFWVSLGPDRGIVSKVKCTGPPRSGGYPHTMSNKSCLVNSQISGMSLILGRLAVMTSKITFLSDHRVVQLTKNHSFLS